MPFPPKKDKILTNHGMDYHDEFAWVQKLEDPDTQGYLIKERAYTGKIIEPILAEYETMYAELDERLGMEADRNIPVESEGYEYYTMTLPDQELPLFCRRRGGVQEVLLDMNAESMAGRLAMIDTIEVSPGGNYLSFLCQLEDQEDPVGLVKKLETGDVLMSEALSQVAVMRWANENTLVYTVTDDYGRPTAVFTHVVGTSTENDAELYVEQNPEYALDIAVSKDKQHLIVGSFSSDGSEIRTCEAARPSGAMHVIAPRKTGLEYYVDHGKYGWIILTNSDGADNYRLMISQDPKAPPSTWKTLIPHNPNCLISDYELFEEFVVTPEKVEGQSRLRVTQLSNGESHYVPVPEEFYFMEMTGNASYRTTDVRFMYSSPLTPETFCEYNMKNKVLNVRRQQQVSGTVNGQTFNPKDFVCERVWADSNGVRVPLTLTHKKSLKRDGSSCGLIKVFGFYGQSAEVGFDSDGVSLLMRDWILATAHVRGGGDLGREWARAGHGRNKKNTIADFLACSEKLINDKYCHPRGLAAEATGEGGLIVGAAINANRRLFTSAVLRGATLEVLTALTDSSLDANLAIASELPDPAKLDEFKALAAIDPYRNMAAGDYPALMLSTPLGEDKVPYWQSAKYLARLRHIKTNENRAPTILNIQGDPEEEGLTPEEFDLQTTAVEYAFLLSQTGEDDDEDSTQSV